MTNASFTCPRDGDADKHKRLMPVVQAEHESWRVYEPASEQGRPSSLLQTASPASQSAPPIRATCLSPATLVRRDSSSPLLHVRTRTGEGGNPSGTKYVGEVFASIEVGGVITPAHRRLINEVEGKLAEAEAKVEEQALLLAAAQQRIEHLQLECALHEADKQQALSMLSAHRLALALPPSAYAPQAGKAVAPDSLPHHTIAHPPLCLHQPHQHALHHQHAAFPLAQQQQGVLLSRDAWHAAAASVPSQRHGGLVGLECTPPLPQTHVGFVIKYALAGATT
jgi:hypothetical protein